MSRTLIKFDSIHALSKVCTAHLLEHDLGATSVLVNGDPKLCLLDKTSVCSKLRLIQIFHQQHQREENRPWYKFCILSRILWPLKNEDRIDLKSPVFFALNVITATAIVIIVIIIITTTTITIIIILIVISPPSSPPPSPSSSSSSSPPGPPPPWPSG